MDFSNKVVLVTGASAGIGETTALLFASRGASLALVGRNAENLSLVGERCKQFKGKEPLLIVADLATDKGVEITAKKTLEHFKRLDVLVNNAGVGARACIERTGMDDFDRVFSTNVRGVYNLTRLLVPALIETKGNIVNISSINGSTAAVGCLPYSMAKAALDHFTQLVALELAPKGVRVNTVSPGLTVSKFTQRITGSTDEEYMAWVNEHEKHIPMGRACYGEHIAKMIAHLASEDSDLVTGAIVPVDGGVRFTHGGTNVLKKQMDENKKY